MTFYVFLFFNIYRYSEKVLNRRNVSETKLEYTTEQIRQELAEKEALLKSNDLITSDSNETEFSQHTASEATTIAEEPPIELNHDAIVDKIVTVQNEEISATADQKAKTKENETRVDNADDQISGTKEPTETKSKKKRRKKSMMKKKTSLTTSSAPSLTTNSTSRKSSSSSSAGSASIIPSEQNDFDTDPNQQSSNATSLSIEDLAKSEAIVTANDSLNEVNSVQETMDTPRMCDFHFFSDTEVAASPYGSRPSTPIQSDSEIFEISQREKNSDPMTSSTASWKWGEFPITPIKADADIVNNKEAKQAERNSTLNTMLSFMKETMRMRKSASDGGVYLSDLMNTEGLDPDVVAKYFPATKNESFSNINDADDHESGNGTSLPHSPSSVENGISKSIAFDFEQDGKLYDKYVFVFSA